MPIYIGALTRRCCVAQYERQVAMTLGVLRVSALALSAAAFVLASPLPAANAASVAHHHGDAAHPRVSHGLHGYVARGQAGHRYVARGHAGHRHYVWRNGHRYAYYGYNPGAAVAAGVIAGAATGYPYCGDYNYVPYYGSCDDYSYGYPYPYYDYPYAYDSPAYLSPQAPVAYYCQAAGAYYPTVTTCAGGWTVVYPTQNQAYPAPQ